MRTDTRMKKSYISATARDLASTGYVGEMKCRRAEVGQSLFKKWSRPSSPRDPNSSAELSPAAAQRPQCESS